jgi:hypothetical protein
MSVLPTWASGGKQHCVDTEGRSLQCLEFMGRTSEDLWGDSRLELRWAVSTLWTARGSLLMTPVYAQHPLVLLWWEDSALLFPVIAKGWCSIFLQGNVNQSPSLRWGLQWTSWVCLAMHLFYDVHFLLATFLPALPTASHSSVTFS